MSTISSLKIPLMSSNNFIQLRNSQLPPFLKAKKPCIYTHISYIRRKSKYISQLSSPISFFFSQITRKTQMSSFIAFYDTWFEQLEQLVHLLSSAPRPATTQDQHRYLDYLVRKVMSHYADYYRFKSLSADLDPLSVFTSPWATSLERSLYWISGWRPTMVFHLLYTESSVLFELKIIDILRGLRSGDLGDLSLAQFGRISEIQCDTVKEENAITDELSEWQESATELLRMTSTANVNGKIEKLVNVMKKADDLRLKTIKQVVELLTPQQAVEFFIAATQLQFGMRGWGTKHDSLRV